jgi:hypothetical protein
MRRWLLLLVVLLLPLRGWMGDAMAGQMLQHSAADMNVHASAVAGAEHAAPVHDCADHAHAAPAPAHEQQAQPEAGTDCRTCASCQVCSSVALSPTPTAVAASAFSHPRPQTVQLAYASADTGLFFKPPRP